MIHKPTSKQISDVVSARPHQLFKPFVLQCPNCMAPTEHGSIRCDYCDVDLVWEPVHSLSRDDSRWVGSFSKEISVKGKTIIGFGPYAVIGATEAILTSRPMRPFKGHKLTIGRELAPNFLIMSLRVGMNYQFISTGPIPATSFCPGEGGPLLDLDVCYPGLDIVLTVQNVSNQACNFAASLEGTTA